MNAEKRYLLWRELDEAKTPDARYRLALERIRAISDKIVINNQTYHEDYKAICEIDAIIWAALERKYE